MTLFGNRVLAVVIKLRISMISHWVREGFMSNDIVLITDSKGHKETRRGDASRRYQQRLVLGCHKPRNARSHQKLEEARKSSPLETLEECGCANSLNLDFRPPQV